MQGSIGAATRYRTNVPARSARVPRRRHGCGVASFLLAGLAGAALCVVATGDGDSSDLSESLASYRDRMLADAALARRGVQDRTPMVRPAFQPDSAPTLPERMALLTEPAYSTSQPAPLDLLVEVPDPSNSAEVFAVRLARLDTPQGEARVVNNYRRVVAKADEYLTQLRKPKQVRLSLAECIQRSLQHNYSVRVAAYNPAISQAQVVQATAAFDAVLFLEYQHQNIDPPPAVISDEWPLQTQTDTYQGGIRQLLPTGMQTSVSLGQSRSSQNYPTAQPLIINPAWTTTFTATFTQPMLRGFGLDYNRATINISKAQQSIDQQTFLQTAQDTLQSVERAYWNLAQARRDVMIQAETVAQNFVTHENIKDRLPHDATQVEFQNSLAAWKQREVAFSVAVNAVHDAEDVLKNQINDPKFKLSDVVEIIPVDLPVAMPVVLDQFAEVRTAVQERNEIQAARLRIEQNRIRTYVAKNETLPQLDVSFTYQAQGLSGNGSNSFHDMAQSDYLNYTVGVVFSYPIGNRGPEAALKAAQLRQEQSVVALQQISDNVVLAVNTAIRSVINNYSNIPAQFDTVRAADLNLRALQARTQTINPAFLQTELDGVSQLNNARRNLLTLLINYNISIVDLERAKGTLLRFDNVRVADESQARR